MADGTEPGGLTGTLTLPAPDIRPAAADLVAPGDVLDRRFEIRRIIARGGMGVVAEAEDRALGTRVALKFIQPALAGDPAARDRFRREILLARRITHPNICRIFEFFSTQLEGGSVLFLTMELLEGETLSARLRAGPLDSATALPLVLQMVDALDAAHAQGIVHLDFKSSNVLLVPDHPSERLVVTDFGIARALRRERARDAAVTSEVLMGTPGYIAPEQVLGEPVTPATDIYALGVVLFEMLSGQLPFHGETPGATALLRLSQPAPRLSSRRSDIDPTWDSVVATCLAREPVFRYATVRDVLRALQGGLAPQPSTPALKETLPAEVTPFVGRARELAAVAALLQRREVRLVTLTGPGGTGKTRLSIEVARALVGDFADGVVFVSLSNVSEPARVAQAIAAALELKEVAGIPIEQVVSSFLRPKRLLLVLDNFEHVLPASPVIGRLLRSAPGLVVVVTSRSRLHLSGEHDVPVPGMGLSTLEATTATAALESDAVRLFVDRAQALSATFEVTDENAADILTLCRRLDGLPLAIELAAARIRGDAPRSLLERLSQSSALQVLGKGYHDADRRQQTLRESIAWSENLLSPEERSLFHALGIVASGTTVEGAAAVAGLTREAAHDLLELLLDKSIIQCTHDPRIEIRFVMLQTLREYALTELQAGGRLEDVRSRHATHCLVVAERVSATIRGPDQGRLLAELEADHEEMRAAIKWFVTHGQREDALRLCVALALFWQVRGYWVEGHRQLSSALEQAAEAPAALRAAALHWLGVLGWSLGRVDDSRRQHEKSMELSRLVAEERLLGEGLHRAGFTAIFQGDRAALQRFTGSLYDLAERLGDDRLRALAHSNRSILEGEVGNLARALTLADEALVLMRRVGDAYTFAFLQNMRGELARLAGDTAGAKLAYETVLRISDQLGSRRGHAVATGNLAEVFAMLGDWSTALQRSQTAVRMHHTIGERLNLRVEMYLAAEAILHLGDPELAARLMGAVDLQLGEPSRTYYAPDRTPIERLRRSITEQLAPERLQVLSREGGSLTLDEAVQRLLAFQPPPS